MNRHYGAAQAITALPYPADALEGVTVLLEAQVEATLALAHAQHTANLIAAYRELTAVEYGSTELGHMADSLALAQLIADRLELPPKPAPPAPDSGAWGA